jgi:hypothetical protein
MITVDDEGLVFAGVARQAQLVRDRQVSPHERQPNDGSTLVSLAAQLERNWNQRARGPTTGHRTRGIAHPLRVDP